MLEEEALDARRHDRQSFVCGVAELDEYLRSLALQQSRKGVAVVRVLVDREAPGTIRGYYSLSAAEVDVGRLDERARKKLPRHPVPCFRLGRLAVQSAQQGRGLGRVLIGCAVERCLEARKHVAAYALLVDAKNSQARKFYEHYGFTLCRDQPATLYLPLGA